MTTLAVGNEIRFRYLTGYTIKAILYHWRKSDGVYRRWNGTALVLPSTILVAAWATGAVTLTELQTGDGSPTKERLYVANLPSGITEEGWIDAYFFDQTPAPTLDEVGQQGFYVGTGGIAGSQPPAWSYAGLYQ